MVDDLTQLLMNVGLEESGKFDEISAVMLNVLDDVMESDLVDDVKKTLESTDFLGKA